MSWMSMPRGVDILGGSKAIYGIRPESVIGPPSPPYQDASKPRSNLIGRM